VPIMFPGTESSLELTPQDILLPPELRNGDASKFGFGIKQLVLQDGDPIDLPAPGITAIVGGNNSGKSTLLRQIASTLSGGVASTPRLLTKVVPFKYGTVPDVVAWLQQHARLIESMPGFSSKFIRPGAQPADLVLIKRCWAGDLGPLASHFVHRADVRERSTLTHGVGRRNAFDDPPTHPMHSLEWDAVRQKELSKISERAFGSALTIDRLSGQLLFRVGIPSIPPPLIDKITPEYHTELASLPTLESQGDGMVFMLGALIPVVADAFPVILIDEPEAFLHPPQAHLMGQALARLSGERNAQVIVATHDRNFLRGLLSEDDAQVAILRLSRAGDRTEPRTLSVAGVRKISNDRILKHTNILEGLFHRLVVLAENERDCQFYQAALDELDSSETLSLRSHDVMFLATNGKGNMAHIAEILKGTGVRVVATPDLDLLNDQAIVKKLVQAVGGGWDEKFAKLWRQATGQFQTTPRGQLNKDVLSAITSILSESPESVLDRKRRERVRQAMRAENPWKELKEKGVHAMTSDKGARDELLDNLDGVGIVLVRVGELENFDRDASRADKDAWLRDALEREAHKGTDAVEHLRRIISPPTDFG
jgi:hypothetical protein